MVLRCHPLLLVDYKLPKYLSEGLPWRTFMPCIKAVGDVNAKTLAFYDSTFVQIRECSQAFTTL